MKKKFAIVFLSLCLVLSLPFAAHANIVTATGRYLITAVKHVAGGAKVTATNTATGAKHVATHGVSAPALGFAIGAGLVAMGTSTGVGLAFQAITGLALDAVDWVMDEENNRVKYFEPVDDGGLGGTMGYAASYGGRPANYGATPFAAASAHCSAYGGKLEATPRRNDASFYIHYCDVFFDSIVIAVGNGKVLIPTAEPVKKYLSLDTLAAKTIELANSGNLAAQKDVEDYVTHLAKNGELDTELDNSTDITPSEEPENPEEPNPDEPQECPSGSVKVDDVCVKIPDSDGDEPLFCDSSEFTKKVCDWIDWTQTEHDEPEPDAGKVDIKDKAEDLSIDNDRIDFSNQCPAPTPINTSVGGFPVSTELNYQPLCDFFTMLNPFVVGMGGISSALIIAGGARRG